MADHVEGAAEVDVVEGDFFGTGKMMPREGGPVLVSHHWELFRRQV
jgi:lipopolysaccharide transport system ATP-binding protein